MLFISSESVSPAVPNCKGDRIQPFLLCGTEPQFITFGLKGYPVCEKAPCTDPRSDLTLQQNSYRTTQADAYVNHAHQTQAQSVNSQNLIKLKQYRVKKTVSPSTPTCWRQAPSFRSRRNTISHRETKTQQTKKGQDPGVDLSYVKLCDTAALVH